MRNSMVKASVLAEHKWGESGFPGGTSGKESTYQWTRCGFEPWVGKISWRRKWQPTPVFLFGEFHGQRSLLGYSARGHRVGHDWATFLFFFHICIHTCIYTYLYTNIHVLILCRRNSLWFWGMNWENLNTYCFIKK